MKAGKQCSGLKSADSSAAEDAQVNVKFFEIQN
jgi:hypothetical protein